MRIKIGTKLIGGFMLIVLLMVALALYLVSVHQKSLLQSVGKSSVFLAKEMLKRINHGVYLKIEELQTHSKHLLLEKALSASNEEFDKLANIKGYISQKDEEWISAPKDEITPFMRELIGNELSDTLKEEFMEFYEKKYGYKAFGEIIVTNKYGANVAQTGKTSDYKQDDEELWQIAKEQGFYVSDVEYCKIPDMYAISIGVRITNVAGDFIGVMKGVLDIKGVVREAEIAAKKYETTRIKVITKDGKLIYKTSAFKFLEDVSEKKFFNKITGESGFFIGKVGGGERLYSYAHSKGYRDFEGLQWILVVAHDTGEVLKPAFVSRNNMVVVSLILIAIGIFVAFFISRSITNPVTGVRDAAVEIAQGYLAKRIEVTSRDEIGQLAHAFNEMAGKLEESYRGLEEKVRERTKELEGANKEREGLNTELSRKNKELEQIVYVTSHDFRSPLVNVQGFTKELDYSLKALASAVNSEDVPIDVREKVATILEEEIPEAMQYIHTSTSKMDSLLSGLLRLSRLGRAALTIEALDMDKLISDVASTFEFQIIEAGVELEISELPTCKGDATQINQVFSNLLENALKFLDSARQGVIRISGTKEEEQSVYCVEDNGIGVAPEYQEKTFEIFHQLNPDTSAGEGLGLTLVSRILDRHSGRIWLESEPGKGSKFFISLPTEK